MKRLSVTVTMSLEVPDGWELVGVCNGKTKNLKVGDQYLLPVLDWLVADEPTADLSLFGMIDEKIFSELDRAVKTVSQDILLVEDLKGP